MYADLGGSGPSSSFFCSIAFVLVANRTFTHTVDFLGVVYFIFVFLL